MKSTKEYIFRTIASILFIITAYLPNNMYLFKAVGLIVLIIAIWMDDLKKMFFRSHK